MDYRSDANLSVNGEVGRCGLSCSKVSFFTVREENGTFPEPEEDR